MCFNEWADVEREVHHLLILVFAGRPEGPPQNLIWYGSDSS